MLAASEGRAGRPSGVVQGPGTSSARLSLINHGAERAGRRAGVAEVDDFASAVAHGLTGRETFGSFA